MAEPSWQELLRLRLAERNAKESSFAPIIEQCMFFSSFSFFFFLSIRIGLLTFGRSEIGPADKVAEGAECVAIKGCRVCTRQPEQLDGVCPGYGRRVGGEYHLSSTEPLIDLLFIYLSTSNPVRAAYMQSLESQISSLRDELATVYKTQGQNAQRLLSMNETLREKEELSRVDTENLRKTREEVLTLRKKVEQHSELMAETDRTAQASFFFFYN